MAGDYERCSRCGSYGWSVCSCQMYTCRLGDHEADDTDTIWVKGRHDRAAERYLDYCWGERDGWEWIKDGEEYIVFVSLADEAPKRFEVTASLTWQYSAIHSEEEAEA